MRAASLPSRLYSCGRCPSGLHSADMDLSDLRRHMAGTHNAVVRGPLALAVRPPQGGSLFARWQPGYPERKTLSVRRRHSSRPEAGCPDNSLVGV